jgi:hypothetical protein
MALVTVSDTDPRRLLSFMKDKEVFTNIFKSVWPMMKSVTDVTFASTVFMRRLFDGIKKKKAFWA